MDMMASSSCCRLYRTGKFHVLGGPQEDIHYLAGRATKHPSSDLPVMRLDDLLLCGSSKTTEGKVANVLRSHLERFGFVVLRYSPTSEAGQVVHDLKRTVDQDLFPTDDKLTRNPSHLGNGHTYVSERGVPMWRLGYEECDDIREAYRVHSGCPDSQPWPAAAVAANGDAMKHDGENDVELSPRESWIRAMALCRHICDEALHLSLGYHVKKRPGSGMRSWRIDPRRQQKQQRTTNHYWKRTEGSIPDRNGDYSVMYAMHYFNDASSEAARKAMMDTTTTSSTAEPETTINVKEHVDPSLFVLEPFLADVEGLQVLPRSSLYPANDYDNAQDWIGCDGPSSPLHSCWSNDDAAMVLFVGKAFATQCQTISGWNVMPTLHRVVAPSSPQNRKTVIYEQKYEEYFPPPAMD